MRKDYAFAAGQSGSATAGTETAGLASASAPQEQDEAHRQSAANELAAYLASARTMLARCEAMAKATRGDRLGPIYAAARLMNANAQVAKVLAQVVLVESRRRMIIETIQPPKPEKAELNSRFFSPARFPSPEDGEDPRAKLERRINALLEASRREQERLEDLAIESCI
jgi:hypothetical protein